MHHGEERVTGQFQRSKEKERKERKNKHKKVRDMDTDGGRRGLAATIFPNTDRQNEVKGEIKMRWQMVGADYSTKGPRWAL